MNEVNQQWRHPPEQPPGAVLLVAPLGAGHMA